MIAFARLLDALAFSQSRTAKLRLLAAYFAATPDPERGWALAALTGSLSFPQAKPALIRQIVASRVDETLFALSYDFVGDLAETAALIWPARPAPGVPDGADLSVTGVVEALMQGGRRGLDAQIAAWLDRLDATGRWALLKLITGALRVGVSARLAKLALADWSGRPIAVIEEVWHGLAPPYQPLFDWLSGAVDQPPDVSRAPVFRPVMLAHPVEQGDLTGEDPAAWRAEWKWDGIRVQLVGQGGAIRLYSRTGDEIGHSFPELARLPPFDGVLDGELLVLRDGVTGSFNDLQQRLNRKAPGAALLRDHPVGIRLYDVLMLGGEDLRPLPFDARRMRLEAWLAEQSSPFQSTPLLDLSPLVPFETWDGLAGLRRAPPDPAIEGLMLKRAASPYVQGRPKGLWYKWKRDPDTVDAVLMYAQRGHGKRSSFYSDFTFGCWSEGVGDKAAPRLLPVGKAYFGFTDAELAELDRWVRAHTTNRFGPVREVAPGLVLEIAFDSVARSKRHKSGVALRFPRINRIRWDKPAAEADWVTTLLRRAAGDESAGDEPAGQEQAGDR